MLKSFLLRIAGAGLLKKVVESLARGISEVWVIEYPKKRLPRDRIDETPNEFHEQDTLESKPVLPGFSCEAAELFHGL